MLYMYIKQHFHRKKTHIVSLMKLNFETFQQYMKSMPWRKEWYSLIAVQLIRLKKLVWNKETQPGIHIVTQVMSELIHSIIQGDVGV